nr:hypothetical protein [Allomuricauda sp.]
MKRSWILFLLFVALLFGCGGSDPVNTVPSVPSLTYPTNELLCIENVLAFRWNPSTDADGDGVSYQIEISSTETFGDIVHADLLNETARTFTLEKGQTFYWRVRAIDDQQNQSAFSTVWRFYTEGEIQENRLPSIPQLLHPSHESTTDQTELDLEWEATDPDVDDVLTFDLYFGTDNNPPLLAEDLSAPIFQVDLSPNTTYYWRVDVKDNQGGVTLGPVWVFGTN